MTKQYQLVLNNLAIPLSIGGDIDIQMKLAGAAAVTVDYEWFEFFRKKTIVAKRVVLEDGAEFIDPLRVECNGHINKGVKLCVFAPLDVTDWVDLPKLAAEIRKDLDYQQQDEAEAIARRKGIEL